MEKTYFDIKKHEELTSKRRKLLCDRRDELENYRNGIAELIRKRTQTRIEYRKKYWAICRELELLGPSPRQIAIQERIRKKEYENCKEKLQAMMIQINDKFRKFEQFLVDNSITPQQLYPPGSLKWYDDCSNNLITNDSNKWPNVMMNMHQDICETVNLWSFTKNNLEDDENCLEPLTENTKSIFATIASYGEDRFQWMYDGYSYEHLIKLRRMAAEALLIEWNMQFDIDF